MKIGIDLGNADVKARGNLTCGQGGVKTLDQILYYVKDIIVWCIETGGDFLGGILKK